MKTKNDRRATAWIFWAVSAFFFLLAFRYPLLQSGFGIGPFTIRSDYVYLLTSFSYFFDKGEVFIGFLLLFFTIIFPILKYIFLALTLAGGRLPKHRSMSTLLEIVNKWAMLDVFIVAVLILNMKFDSQIIISKIQAGTTLFALAVILLMVASFLSRKIIDAEINVKNE